MVLTHAAQSLSVPSALESFPLKPLLSHQCLSKSLSQSGSAWLPWLPAPPALIPGTRAQLHYELDDACDAPPGGVDAIAKRPAVPGYLAVRPCCTPNFAALGVLALVGETLPFLV